MLSVSLHVSMHAACVIYCNFEDLKKSLHRSPLSDTVLVSLSLTPVYEATSMFALQGFHLSWNHTPQVPDRHIVLLLL